MKNNLSTEPGINKNKKRKLRKKIGIFEDLLMNWLSKFKRKEKSKMIHLFKWIYYELVDIYDFV